MHFSQNQSRKGPTLLSDLSIAELQVLESPNNNQIQQTFHVTINEMALLGWINVGQGTRKTPLLVYVFAIGFCIFLYTLNPVLMVVAALFLGYKLIYQNQRTTLISPTEKGRIIAEYPNQPDTFLANMMRHVNAAVVKWRGNCTIKEWHQVIDRHYSNNEDFYKKALQLPLVQKGLLEASADGNGFIRTAAGDRIFKEAEEKIKNGANLAHMLRNKLPDAAQKIMMLGTLVLLMPELEGYYQPMAATMQGESFDLDKRQQQPGSDGSISSDSGGESDTPDEHQHDLDYESSSDFLDGSFDSSGGDSGCGVGSDGDSSDGGDGGGCSGCGGCGGD